MRCLKPFVSGRVAFGCGQCPPCRFNRRRTWMHRIMLEASQHAANSFATLTFRDLDRRYSLDPDDLRKWLYRFRKKVRPSRVRYFAVGEYGDENDMAHYHAAIFGFPPCAGGRVEVVRREDGRRERNCLCMNCCAVRETWGFGHIHLGTLTAQSAQYIAGYVVKKLTSVDDTRLSAGQHPEFARMSLRPGIGADAMWDVASEMMRRGQSGRMVSQLRQNGKVLPLGRYLRLKLSERLGHSEEERASLSDQALSRLYEEMSSVWDLAISGKVRGEDGETIVSPSRLLGEINKPYARALEGRFRMRRRNKL